MWKPVRLLYLCTVLLLLLPLSPAQAQGPQPGVRVKVVARQVNVRAAPNAGAQVLGILYRGALVDTSGVSPDKSWFSFLYWGRPAWISAGYVQTVESSLQGDAARLVQYSIEPSVPVPDQTFIIHLTLQSSHDLAAFKVAASCQDFALLNVPRLAATVAQIFDLPCPGDPATGAHQTTLILDTDRAVSPGASVTLTYWVDRPYNQITMSWPAYSDLNMDGAAFDLAFDGVTIRGLNGAQIWPLSDPDLATIHYDLLAPPDRPRDMLPPSGVIGVRTASGARGTVHILQGDLNGLRIEFRVYL